MENRYFVQLTQTAREDLEAIHDYHRENAGVLNADRWEDGLDAAVRRVLVYTPHLQIAEYESNLLKREIRRMVYQREGSSVRYLLFLLCQAGVEEMLDVIGDLGRPEPERDHVGGDIFVVDERTVAPLAHRTPADVGNPRGLADGDVIATVGFFKNNSHVSLTLPRYSTKLSAVAFLDCDTKAQRADSLHTKRDGAGSVFAWVQYPPCEKRFFLLSALRRAR